MITAIQSDRASGEVGGGGGGGPVGLLRIQIEPHEPACAEKVGCDFARLAAATNQARLAVLAVI